jgi:membrane fusion protein, heavy metal efflux system
MRNTLQLLLTLFLLVIPACGQPEQSEQDGHNHIHGHDHREGEERGREEEHGHDEHGHGEHSDEVTLTTEAIMRYGIAIEPVKRHSLLSAFVAPARVSYNAEAIAFVGTPVPGRVSDIHARLGDTVAEGDLLLSIESPEFAEVQSDFRSKRAAMHAAASSYERASKLKKSQGIALSEVQKRQAELKSAEAAANAAESILKLYGITSQRIEAIAHTGTIESLYPLHAPIAGTVIDRNVSLGERVGPDP